MGETIKAGESPVESKRDSKPLLVWLGFGLCLKCFAFSVLMVVLLLCILFTALQVPLGIAPLTLGGSLKLIYHAAMLPVLTLIGQILISFSPWGFITLVILALVLRGPDWIRESLSSGRLKFGPFEYEGNVVASAFKRELTHPTG